MGILMEIISIENSNKPHISYWVLKVTEGKQLMFMLYVVVWEYWCSILLFEDRFICFENQEKKRQQLLTIKSKKLLIFERVQWQV